MNRDEFEKYWRSNETPEFVEWFANTYGYDCRILDEDEYWSNRVFALRGWIACKKVLSVNYYDKALSDVEAAIEELKQR